MGRSELGDLLCMGDGGAAATAKAVLRDGDRT
jgi:hypothetical protein